MVKVNKIKIRLFSDCKMIPIAAIIYIGPSKALSGSTLKKKNDLSHHLVNNNSHAGQNRKANSNIEINGRSTIP